MPLTCLYAEYLLNIRQVTVFATLPSSASVHTIVNLTSGGQTLELTHNSELTTIHLPAAVCDEVRPETPRLGFKNLSFRFPIESGGRGKIFTNSESPQWLAPNIEQGAQISCLKCENTLADAIREWKDLPSGGWAEMMDFWHCHKPSAPTGEKASMANAKGYAAGNAIGPAAGVGLVDVTHFLLHPSNCPGIEVSLWSDMVTSHPSSRDISMNLFVLSELGQQEGGLLTKDIRPDGKAADTIALK